MFKRRVRAGDRIDVDGQRGIVQEVGLSRLLLEKQDGSTVVLPNRLLDTSAVTIAREKFSQPVVLRFRLSAPITQAVMERARRAALLSPYRASGSSVRVRVEENRLLSVELSTFTPRASRQAELHLDASLRDVLSEELADAA